MSRRFIPFALAMVTMLGGSSAFAQEEEPFSKAGVINIASDLSLSIQNTSFSGDGSPKSGRFGLWPKLEFGYAN